MDIDLAHLTANQGLTITPGIYNTSSFGMAIDGIGDFNKDGFDDIIIGDQGGVVLQTGNFSNVGRTYIVFGNNDYADTFNIVGISGEAGFELWIPGSRGFGYAVSGIGDFNGDNFADLIIGDPSRSSSHESGYVLFGTDTTTQASYWVDNYQNGERFLNGNNGFELQSLNLGDFGRSVTTIGDYNGDGFDDFAIGSYDADHYSAYYGGETYVLFGTDKAMSPSVELEIAFSESDGFAIITSEEYSYLGTEVSGAGDFNGDGYKDVLVGAPEATVDGAWRAGKSAVIWGGPQILSKTVDVDKINGVGIRINGDDESNFIGSSLSSIGDFNQDGVDDIIIGNPSGSFNGLTNSGDAYVLFGVKNNPDSLISLVDINCENHNGFIISGENEGDGLSTTLSSTDFNGDGIQDIVLGASGASMNGQVNAGKVYIVFGGGEPNCALVSEIKVQPQKIKSTVSPNPTTGVIYLNGFALGERIELKDLQGKVLMSTVLLTNTIDLSYLIAGVYLLKQNEIALKIIKQ